MATRTTTVTSTETAVNTAIRYDPTYVRTLPGILKCVCVVLNLAGFICIQCSRYSYLRTGTFFNCIAMIGFWFTGILLVFYLFHVIERFFKIPWLKIELIFCVVWAVLYLIASCLAATTDYAEAYQVAAFFGFCAMVAYGYDAFLKFRGVQAGEIAQCQKHVVRQQQQQTVVSPASIYPA